MTTGLDSLSPSRSKTRVRWVLAVLVAVFCLPISGWAAQVGTRISTYSGTIVRPSIVIPQQQGYNRTGYNRTGKTSQSSSIKAPSIRPIPSFRPAQQQPAKGRFVPSQPITRVGKTLNFLPPPVKTGLTSGDSYTVGPQDVLAIEVFDNPDLKGEYTVSEHGDIVFPLIGQVKVSDKTPDAIKAEITRLLEKDYLFNPIVRVDVSKYLSKKVKIMGNVDKPGEYYLDGPLRLFDLLTKAGGIAKQTGGTIMSGQKAHIVRAAPENASTASPDKTRTYYVDLHQLLVEGKDELNVYLQPGDVIFVPDTDQFHVIGEVKKTGTYPFEEGLTLLKAITLAGGLTEKGSSDNAVIKRMKNGRVVEMKANMDTLLSPDDTVYVPENLDSFQVIGEVKNPGSFRFKEGTSLLKAIALAGGLTEKAAADDAVIKRVQYGRTVEIRASMDTLLTPNDTVSIPEDKKYIHVVGEVKHADSFPYEKGITLLNAINYAGGATQKGSVEDAIIKRLSNGRTIEMKGGVDTRLQAGDTVFVPKARSVEVVGEVKNPGSIPYEPGMSLLKAIDLAGGATLEGSTEDAVIKRLNNGRMVEMKASMYTSVQPDDTVFVPEAKSVEVVGEVKRPGSIRYESGMSLLKAIDLAGGATLKGSVENAVIKRMSNGRVAEMKASMYTSVQPDDTIFVPELRSFHVTGEVKQPGSFPYEPRLTLLRAIAMAGGATKKAAPDDSIIKRVKNGKIEEIEATMDTLILPDDVIEVPLSFW